MDPSPSMFVCFSLCSPATPSFSQGCPSSKRLRWEAWCAPGDTWTAAYVPKMVSFSLPSDRSLSQVPLLTPSATQEGQAEGAARREPCPPV